MAKSLRGTPVSRPQPRLRWSAVCTAFALCLLPVLTRGADAGISPPPARNPAQSMLVSNVTFVVFDTETTGFSPTSDRMVELGVVKFRNGKILEDKSWLINPQRHIPYWATKVHSITDEDVKKQPTFKDVYPEFLEFISGSVLMAHNARFDIAFLSEEARRAKLELPRNLVIDSLSLFRRWFPKSKSHSVEEVAKYTEVETAVLHRAMADSMYVFLIFDKGLQSKAAGIKLRDIYADCGGPLKF